MKKLNCWELLGLNFYDKKNVCREIPKKIFELGELGLIFLMKKRR